MKRKRLRGLWLIVILVLTGCQESEVPVQGVSAPMLETVEELERSEEVRVYLDGYGAALAMAEPQRVIALNEELAEIWKLAGGKLLALPEQKADGTITAEELLKLEPDFVILSASEAAQGALKADFAKAGVAATYFNVSHFADYLSMLELCTELTGRRDLFETYGLKLQKEITEILAANRRDDRPRVALIAVSEEGAEIQNASSLTGRMLQELGCVNICDEKRSFAGPFDAMAVLQSNPDYIFVVAEVTAAAETALQKLLEAIPENSVFQCWRAVREERLLLLTGEHFSGKPNQRWAESYRQLAEFLT